jgi:hypothetical protein
VTILAKPKMFNLGYATSLPDDSHHSPTTKVAQLPMAVRVEALRNHIDSRQDPRASLGCTPVFKPIALATLPLLKALPSARKCAEATSLAALLTSPCSSQAPFCCRGTSTPINHSQALPSRSSPPTELESASCPSARIVNSSRHAPHRNVRTSWLEDVIPRSCRSAGAHETPRMSTSWSCPYHGYCIVHLSP